MALCAPFLPPPTLARNWPVGTANPRRVDAGAVWRDARGMLRTVVPEGLLIRHCRANPPPPIAAELKRVINAIAPELRKRTKGCTILSTVLLGLCS